MKLLILALSAVLFLVNAQSAQPCAPQCRFRLCQGDGLDTFREGPRLQVRPTGIVSIPFVCKTNPSLPDIGRIIRTAEALVADASESRMDNNRTYSRISQFMRGSVSPKFKKRFYGLSALNSPAAPGRSGISRQRSRGNQASFLNDLCVRIPIRRYEEISGGVTKVKRVNGATDCVSFRTIFSQLLIDLVWDNSDDLDMRVITPNGDVVSRFFERAAGAVYTTSTQPTCGTAFAGRDLVSWQRNAPQPGNYRVEVRHFTKCASNAPVNFTVRVSSGDKVRRDVSMSSSSAGGFKTVANFIYPF